MHRRADNTTRFLLLETSLEEAAEGASAGHKQWRAIVRLDTTAASEMLTILVNQLTLNKASGLSCHIRSIERRARKDAVDREDGMQVPKEGLWPFVYVIEIEGKQAPSFDGRNGGEQRESKKAKVDNDGMATASFGFSRHLHKALLTAQLADQPGCKAACLGIWPVSQDSL